MTEAEKVTVDLEHFARSMRQLASTLTAEDDPTRLCYELSDKVVEVLRTAGAGVSVADGSGALRYVTATNERAAEIERVQEKTQDGPCMTAYQTDDVVAIADVRETDRWPEYLDTADEVGFHAVLGVPMRIRDDKVGALNIYNADPRDWTDTDINVAWTFADMATVCLLRSSEVAEAGRINDQLQQALDSRVLIEQAKGMIARRNDIDVDKAFELLRAHARSKRIKLSNLARDVVDRAVDVIDSVTSKD